MVDLSSTGSRCYVVRSSIEPHVELHVYTSRIEYRKHAIVFFSPAHDELPEFIMGIDALHDVSVCDEHVKGTDD